MHDFNFYAIVEVMQEKYCNSCRTTKPVAEFHKRGSKWQAHCKVCASFKQAQRYADLPSEKKERRKQLSNLRLESLKAEIRKIKEAPCTDCGQRYPPYVMDFDHVEDNKDFGVSYAVGSGLSRETILAEIAKCELVCANCHRVRTHKRLAQ